MATRISPEKKLQKLWPKLTAGDPKAVHEARKLTRRASAELAASGAPKSARRAWRDLRRAAAALRDHDVAGDHIAAALEEGGRSAAEVGQFRTDWAERRAHLLARTEWPAAPEVVARPEDFRDRVRRALRREARDLLEEAPGVLKADQAEIWHDWRKRLKHYRYTLELQEGAPKVLTETLEALGRMQDAEVVRALLTEHDYVPGQRKPLQKREKEARLASQAQVRALWPELKKHLKAQRKKVGRRAAGGKGGAE